MNEKKRGAKKKKKGRTFGPSATQPFDLPALIRFISLSVKTISIFRFFFFAITLIRFRRGETKKSAES